ncbi:PREDICTED: probable 28S ribosomal protein S16, mitochondrial [Branchiostoma belcheri]|uniref:Small ribosomal subunit protein bS16m n=1 Tax=Branchiostoma belcheri TaxID=7741 RepID=A0A6P4Y9T0_BRABE|nr:PREDICTED: probable 28S ribosomal protein S16, mitochondrial [Branchiostoma belcheri]
MRLTTALLGWRARYRKLGPKSIRLSLSGCTNRPFYHIVVAPTPAGRDKEIYEQLGTYDPLPNDFNEKLVSFNYERLKHWLAMGATPTKPVAQLLGLSGFLPLHPMSSVIAERKRKAAAEKAAQQEAEEKDQSATDGV